MIDKIGINTPNANNTTRTNKTSATSSVQTDKLSASGETSLSTKDINIQNIDEKARQLGAFLEGLEQSAQTVGKAQGALETVQTLLSEAANALSQGGREDAAKIVASIGEVVEKAGLNGVNLLKSDTLETPIQEKPGVPFSITGLDVNAQSLGLSNPQSLSDVAFSLASEQVSQISQYLQDGLKKINNSQNFTQNVLQSMETAGGGGVKSQSEEGANLLALQTKQLLSKTNSSLAAEAQQAIVSLF